MVIWHSRGKLYNHWHVTALILASERADHFLCDSILTIKVVNDNFSLLCNDFNDTQILLDLITVTKY